MLGLALHTCSPQLGLALKTVEAPAGQSASEPVDRHQVWDLGREVSSHLHVKLMEFMVPYGWEDLSFVAVAKGPGGFTGTRIGVVAARTLAQQLNIPLFGVSTLAAFAASMRSETGRPLVDLVNQDIAITMPAKREAVYGAIYRPAGDGSWVAVLADTVMPEEKWAKTLARWERPLQSVSADLNAQMDAQMGTQLGTQIAESVTGVMTLAALQWAQGHRPEWSTVMPFYGQHPVDR